MNHKLPLARLAGAALTALSSLPALAANPALQDLFFAACANPTGALAARCAETTDALGDLSGDSETSLNPSQTLSANQTSLRSALGNAEDARGRYEGMPAGEGVRIEMGRFSLLASYGHTWEERDRVQDADNERGFEADTDSGAVGFDYRLSETSVLGLMLSYESMSLDFDGNNPGVNFTPASSAGSIDSDNLGVTAFASIGFDGGGYLDLSAGYRSGDTQYKRFSVFQESTRTLPQTNSVTEGKADTTELWASANLGWQIPLEAWNIGVYGGFTCSSSEVDAYREQDRSGTGLAMAFAGADQDSFIGTLGVRAQRALSTRSGVLLPYVRIDYSHEFKDDPLSLRTRYLLDADGNTLRLASDKPDTDFFIAALGLSAVLPNGWMPFIDLSYWGAYEDLDRVRLQAGLRKEL
ncbi:MAG: autotransporter outer membrane beta-barrel domain-containing protein [Pseudomonadales bacterium]